MSSFKEIILVALTPLIKINMAGLIIGAIWVGMTMQWTVIGIGIIVACFSSNFIPLLMVPVGIFSHFMVVYRGTKQKNKEQLMFVLSVAYILLFLTMWCVSILEFVITRIDVDVMAGGLIWANSIAMLPLLMWIDRDHENILIMTLIETAQIAILLLSAIKFVWVETPFWMVYLVFGGILSIMAVLMAVNDKKSVKNSKENSH